MEAMLAAILLATPPVLQDLDVTFWHGPDQVYGELGRPQAQINILGNVFSADGLQELYFSLDGAPERPLSFGPDTRRLLKPGDFNIELFLDQLPAGEHQVVVRAIDVDGDEFTRSLDFTLMPETAWPLPYTAQWSTAFDIQSAAQSVDGRWVIGPGGVRCPDMGYDRLLAIGDTTWTDYEVTVPITIHAVDPAGYNPPSHTPGVGIVMRWNGHTDQLIPGSQPYVGYWPLGGVAEFVYHLDQCGARLQLYGNPFTLRAQDDDCTPLELEVTYLWKMRVRTLANGKHEYKVKVWQQGLAEPGAWNLSMVEEAWQPSHGCLLLLAHHVDATFGNVQVTHINGDPAAPPEFTPIRSRAKLSGDDVRTGKVIYREVIKEGALMRRFNATVRNANPGETFDVLVDGAYIGSAQADDTGKAVLEMRSLQFIDDPCTQQVLPNAFPPIIDLQTVSVGSLSGVFFDALYTLPEGADLFGPQYRVMGEFDDAPTGLEGKVIYRERIKNGKLDRKLIVHVWGGEPGTFRWLRLPDGEKVERIWFDATGFGQLELRTPAFIDNPAVELPMSAAFPSLLPFDAVRVGPVMIEVVE